MGSDARCLTLRMRTYAQVLSAKRMRATSRPVQPPMQRHGTLAERTNRQLYVTRCVIGVLTGLLLLVVLGAYSTQHVNRTFTDLGQSGIALLAAVNCALAARSSSGRLRVAWGGLAGATLSWGLGQAVWSWYELVQHTATPFPGLADLGFLGFPLGAVIGPVAYTRLRAHETRA